MLIEIQKRYLSAATIEKNIKASYLKLACIKTEENAEKKERFQPMINVLSMYDPANLYVTYINQFMEQKS